MRYFIAVHVVLEDGFQSILYTMVASSKVQDRVSVSALFGSIQSIFFLLLKSRELWQLKIEQERPIALPLQ